MKREPLLIARTVCSLALCAVLGAFGASPGHAASADLADDPVQSYAAAREALRTGQWGVAELLLERTLMLQPEHAEALLDLAGLLAQRGRTDGARALVAMLLADPRTPAAHRERLQALLNQAEVASNARQDGDGSMTQVAPAARTVAQISLGYSRNPLLATSAGQIELTTGGGNVVLPVADAPRAGSVLQGVFQHQWPSGLGLSLNWQQASGPESVSGGSVQLAGPLGAAAPAWSWELGAQQSLNGGERFFAGMTREWQGIGLTLGVFDESQANRRGWLARAQRTSLPTPASRLQSWAELEHAVQGATSAVRLGAQWRERLASRWDGAADFHLQADTTGYSPLLANNAPRRIATGRISVDYLLLDLAKLGRVVATGYTSRRWSNLSLFSWVDYGVQLAWLPKL